jgi:di/tripeptidase
MIGPTGIERAHAVDEWVAIEEVATVARTIVRIVIRHALPAA